MVQRGLNNLESQKGVAELMFKPSHYRAFTLKHLAILLQSSIESSPVRSTFSLL